MGGAIDCLVSSLKTSSCTCCSCLLRVEIDTDHTAAGLLYSDDSIVVLNVKEEARVGRKWHVGSLSSMSSVGVWSVGLDRLRSTLQWFELLLGMHSSLLWPTL